MRQFHWLDLWGKPDLNEWEQFNVDMDLWELEQEWRRTLPKHTPVGWLQIFPEAKARWGKQIKNELQEEQLMLELELKDVEYRTVYDLKRNNDPQYDIEYTDTIYKNIHTRETLRINKRLTAIKWQLKLLASIGSKKPVKEGKHQPISEAEIAHAREFPLENLIEINRSRLARCIWHNERTPSMNCRNNFVYCHSCGKSGDVIAVVMQLENLSFREAVKRLQ